MRTIAVDSQLLSMFQECPEKFRLMFRQNLRPTFQAPALSKGDVLHVGLEAYYSYLKQELVGEQDRSIIHTNGVELAINEARARAALIDINLEEAEEIVYQITEYLDFYKNDDIVPIEVEQPFITQIYQDEELRILYVGKIDLVATASRYQWKPTPFDNKSSGRNQTPSGRSNQFLGYCNALDSNLLVVNKIGFQKTLGRAERFRRYPLSYPKEYREKWVRNTIKTIHRLVWCIDNDEWEENFTSCDKYSGCIMKPICEAITPEARDWKIQSEYIEVSPWDVTKALGGNSGNDGKNDERTKEGIER